MRAAKQPRGAEKEMGSRGSDPLCEAAALTCCSRLLQGEGGQGAPLLDTPSFRLGFAYMLEDLAEPHLTKGRLVRVLEKWCPLFPGYYPYCPSWRQNSLVQRYIDRD
jgi:DNA-binding transcriptional LysR family regulator